MNGLPERWSLGFGAGIVLFVTKENTGIKQGNQKKTAGISDGVNEVGICDDDGF